MNMFVEQSIEISSFSNSPNDTFLLLLLKYLNQIKFYAEEKTDRPQKEYDISYCTHPNVFLPPVLGLVLLKFSPADAALVQPPPSPDAAAGSAGAAEDEAVGLAQSGSPYCPLIFQLYFVLLHRLLIYLVVG